MVMERRRKPAKRARTEPPKPETTEPPKPESTDRKSDFLPDLLRSGRYSDLQVKCEGETFNVHKSVVCAQSPVLARAVDGNFQEATTGVIVIEEFSANVVRQMVAFLYDGEYKTDVEQPDVKQPQSSDGSAGKKEADASLLFHMRMNAIADYYDIKSLRAASRDKLHLALEQVRDGGEILELASTARESNGDKKLHGVLATAAVRHLPQLIKDGTLADHCKDEFEYQLIVACEKKMAADAEFQRTLPPRFQINPPF